MIVDLDGHKRLGVRYGLVSAMNLLILCLGIAIGMLIAPRWEQRVFAGQVPSQAQQAASTAQASVAPEVAPGQITFYNGVRIIGVAPMISGGSGAFYQVLSHHLQTDEIVANGFDLLQLQQGELNLLQRVVPKADVDAVINSSRANEILKVATKAPQPVAPKK